MNWKNCFRKITWFFGRSIILYIGIFLFLNTLFKQDDALGKARLRTLNRIIPYMDDMARVIDEKAELNRGKLKEYLHYYKLVDEYIPDRDDTKALIGFCYYHLGNKNKALSFYKKSIELNPHFFWPHYNLGAIYFENKQYTQAVEAFKKAIEIRSDITLKTPYLSKVYRDILIKVKDSRNMMEKEFERGYRDAFRALALSSYHLKDFSQMRTYSTLAIKMNVQQKNVFYYYAGLAAYELKDYGNAIHFFQEYMKRDPVHGDSLHYIGLSLGALGQKAVSVRTLQKAVILKRRNSVSLLENDAMKLRIF